MLVLDHIARPLYLGLDVGIDPDSASNEHLEVLDAVRAHEQARARQLMASQIVAAEERMLASVKKNGLGMQL